MLNHYRTLLANVPPGDGEPAEERVPAGFAPVRLPDSVRAVRRVLFGENPDRAMVNYRCRQLLAGVHASPLADWVTRLDPRITYDFADVSLVAPAVFRPVVVQTAGTAAKLTVLGAPTPPDVTGRMRSAYEVDVLSTSTVSVFRQTEPVSKTILKFSLVGGASGPLPLPGAGYSFRLYTDNPGAMWAVDVYNRPARDAADLLADLESVGDARLTALFGLEAGEPWATLRRVWREARETPLRLAAAVTAAVYRTEEARLGR